MFSRRRSQLLPLDLPYFEDIQTTFSKVRLEPETDGSYTVIIDGMESSHIHPNPTTLVFEYMRWIFNILTSTYNSNSPLQIAHLGGGAAALPRAVSHHFPQSHNSVVELDTKLIELVRSWVDLPKSPRVAIRNDDAFKALETWRDQRFDVMIRDVFSHSRTPLPLRSVEAAGNARRTLKADGLFIANVAMDKDQQELASELVTLREVFGQLQVVAEPSAIKKRRISNCLILAGNVPITELAERKLRTDAVPVRILDQPTVDRLCTGGKIISVTDSAA